VSTEQFRRKLTAILSADVKGYSRLMGDDEVATIRTLTIYRDVMSNLIQRYQGRVVDSPGDNLLAEFTSVVNAVQCAIEVQGELKTRNDALPENRRMAFRIGINMGDVIDEDNRIYGQGINIAARLETLAEAGGICISGTVYDSIKRALDIKFEFLGEQNVKNIAEPIRVYRVCKTGDVEYPKVYTGKNAGTKKLKWAVVAGVVILVLGAGAAILWNLYFSPKSNMAAVSLKESAVLPLPEKPSIAVLPFNNLSGDPGQEYFSDGITENIITSLSKIPQLFVIARNSTFTYKGKPVRVQQVGRELGVQHVLEGSVQKSGNRIRITAQLIDAKSGYHLWAERYDQEMKDIFAIQDEVTQKIISALAIKFAEGEQKQLAYKNTDNIEAYDYFLRGLEYHNRFTKEANTLARQMFNKAIELDPEYVMAYTKLGWTHLMDWLMNWSPGSHSFKNAAELAKKAIALDETLPEGLCLLGNVYLWEKQHETAISLYEKAIRLEPNYAYGLAELGGTLNYAQRPQEAIELLKKAIRLNPLLPGYPLYHLGHSYYLTRRYDQAIKAFEGSLSTNPDFLPAHIFLAAIYAELDQRENARAEMAIIQKQSPQTSFETLKRKLPYKDPAVLERVLAAISKAGLQ